MITRPCSNEPLLDAETGHTYLCVHGHFYQPSREDPFTGQIPDELEATPFANFNEKITSECYRTLPPVTRDLLLPFIGWEN